MASMKKTSPSFKALKGYGIPHTLSRVEDEWCERVAASIIDFRLKKEMEIEALACEVPEDPEEESTRDFPLHRLNCDLEDLGEDRTDPTEGSFSRGKHDILRVGYSQVTTRKWKNATRIKKPPKTAVERYRPSRRHKAVPSIKVDAPIDGKLTSVTPRSFHWKSKLPPIYKEIKSVMQPRLPTTGNESRFAAIPKLVSFATEIWKEEEEEAKKREEDLRERASAGL